MLPASPADGIEPQHECPEYDIKTSDGEAPLTPEIWGNAEHPFITFAPRSTQAWSGNT